MASPARDMMVPQSLQYHTPVPGALPDPAQLTGRRLLLSATSAYFDLATGTCTHFATGLYTPLPLSCTRTLGLSSIEVATLGASFGFDVASSCCSQRTRESWRPVRGAVLEFRAGGGWTCKRG